MVGNADHSMRLFACQLHVTPSDPVTLARQLLHKCARLQERTLHNPHIVTMASVNMLRQSSAAVAGASKRVAALPTCAPALRAFAPASPVSRQAARQAGTNPAGRVVISRRGLSSRVVVAAAGTNGNGLPIDLRGEHGR